MISSLPSSKESLFLHAEAESSDTVIMPVMVTNAANIKEQLTSMKATLDRLSRESSKKDAQIKRQNEQIVELMKRLEKKSFETSNKGSDEEDSIRSLTVMKSLMMSARQERITP